MWEILLYGLVVGSVTGAIIYLTSCCEDYDIYDRKNRLKWNKITRYKNCDILHHYNNGKMCGYSKKISEEEMIGLAVLNGCPVNYVDWRKWKMVFKRERYNYEHHKTRNTGKYWQI